MISKNVRLKAELFKKSMKLDELSEKTGIPRPYLSMGQNGRYVFTAEEQRKIAKSIGCKVEDIF